MNRLTLVAILGLFSMNLFSQEKWEGGILLGYSNYLGDMVEPSLTFDQANFAGGIFLRHHFTGNFGLRSNLTLGKIDGADANYERLAARGASFETNIIELSLLGEYEFFGHRRWDKKGHRHKIFSPYIYAGMGVAFTNAAIDLDAAARPDPAKSEDLMADFNEDVQFALPIGFGVKLDVSRRMNIGLDWGWRLTFSDYLDGLSVAGNPDDDDWYIVGGVTAGFLLGDDDADDDGVVDDEDKCPDIPGLRTMRGCPDSDGDGTPDAKDDCPNTPGKILHNGCPDRDGDGIADNIDDCPDMAGLRRFSGCPDTDSDGFVDSEDNCPEVPGIAAMSGCPDTDRDGIQDDEDDCPKQPGPVSQNGCPDIDSDRDGVLDNEDECPNTPGMVALKGCPDSDRDGLADGKDKCPNTPGLRSNDGCPEAILTAEDLSVKTVRFETNETTLSPASMAILDQVVGLLKSTSKYGLSIIGYTDDVGNDFANQQLSEGRAKRCFDYLVAKGIDPDLMTYEGQGETNPIASNFSLEGRRKNRRVELKLKRR